MSHATPDPTAAERRAADAEAALARAKILLAAEREARKIGFEYPDLAATLVDRTRVSYDHATGGVAGVEDAVARLARERPGLLRHDATRTGGTPPGPAITPRLDPEAAVARSRAVPTPAEDLMRLGGYDI